MGGVFRESDGRRLDGFACFEDGLFVFSRVFVIRRTVDFRSSGKVNSPSARRIPRRYTVGFCLARVCCATKVGRSIRFGGATRMSPM